MKTIARENWTMRRILVQVAFLFILLVLVDVVRGQAIVPDVVEVPDAATSNPDRDVEATVRDAINQSIAATRTIQYDLVFEWGAGLEIHGRFARDGQKVYQASIMKSGNGGLGPVGEAAWDGKIAFMRDFEMLSVSADIDRWHQSMGFPDQHLVGGLTPVMGVTQTLPHVSYAVDQEHSLVDAREREDGRVQITYLSVGPPEPIYTRTVFDPDFEYWPVEQVAFSGDGRVLYSLVRVDYVRQEAEAGRVIFPRYVELRNHVGPGGQPLPHEQGRLVFRVDETTLKINEPIPASRFTMQAWPNQRLQEWDTGKTHRPADPNWEPAGKVDFPWDEFAAAIARSRARNQEND